MGIFQKSVIQKHLANYDSDVIEKAWVKFSENYSDTKIQKIKLLKEEEYQDGFLRDIFVDVLNYTLKPDENYNLVREFKNQSDGKKADGAILKNENAIAVIELKSIKTKDLTNVTQQAFNYKNDQPECKYIITSNFQKLRFYVDYSNEYEEFDLFNLQKSDFELLYLILNKDSLLSDLPLKLKEETKFHEEYITNKLYNDYSNFKNNVFENLIKNNSEYDKLTLFKKSQKFLDRLLFIFFAEDTGLIPPNTISKIIEQWQSLIDLDEHFTLYSRFVKFFKHLNEGHKYKDFELPAYNGGLFAPDDLLDNFKIDDEILKNDSLKLSSYDFNSDVDVNILGHIFEHSLNEIEEMEQYLSKNDNVSISNTSKRKKDGVFYTPKFITQYITENTIGALCKEKRTEMELNDIEYDESYKTKKGALNQNGKKLYDKLLDYKKWLLSLKILDPACGSGAFLNQALQFLMTEHKQIDELIADLTNDRMGLFDTDKAILENNLFGVDINEESVEIAKLSLWLRTAQKGRQLSDLSNNIKCGNSLINNEKLAGDKAFDWKKEYKIIMDSGGFDVVIGNPPYFVLSTLSKKTQKELSQNFINAEKSGDIYCVFYELGLNLLKDGGFISYITSSQWLQAQYGKTLRDFLISKYNPVQLIDFGGIKIFKDATVDSSILIIEKKKCENNLHACKIIGEVKTSEDITENVIENSLHITDLKADRWLIINNNIRKLREQIKLNKSIIKEHNVEILRGILTGFNKAFIIDTTTKEELCKNNPENMDILKPILRGRDIHRFYNKWDGLWLITTLPSMEIDIEKYPSIKNYLHTFGKRIEQTGESGCRKKTNNKWFETQDTIAYYKKIYEKKIIYPETTARRAEFHIDKSGVFIDKTAFMITGENLPYYQAILASKLMQWYLEFDLRSLGKSGIQYSKLFIENTPIPIPNKKTANMFDNIIDKMTEFNSELQTEKNDFLQTLKEEKNIAKFNKILLDFQELDYETFKKELFKKKIIFNLGTENNEWRKYFSNTKEKIKDLQIHIYQTDKELNAMVYELYELSEVEIGIVEGVV